MLIIRAEQMRAFEESMKRTLHQLSLKHLLAICPGADTELSNRRIREIIQTGCEEAIERGIDGVDGIARYMAQMVAGGVDT